MERHNRFIKTSKNQAGFSIVEVMIAMAIFSIGILAVWSMQLNSATGNTKAQSVTYSSEGAMGQIEWILAQGMGSGTAYNSLASDAPSQDADGIDNNYNGQIDEAGEDGPLSISWVVNEIVPDSTTDIYNYKIVTITVTKTMGGDTRTITLENRVPKII